MIISRKCTHCGEVAQQDISASVCPFCCLSYSQMPIGSVPPTSPAATLTTESAAQPPSAKPISSTTRRADQKFCYDCGTIISLRAEICPKCGVRQHSSIETPASQGNQRQKTVAAMLGLLLGGIGMHKFYLGKPMQGILYIVFCLTFIPAVLGFIEGIQFLIMSESKFANQHEGPAWSAA